MIFAMFLIMLMAYLLGVHLMPLLVGGAILQCGVAYAISGRLQAVFGLGPLLMCFAISNVVVPMLDVSGRQSLPIPTVYFEYATECVAALTLLFATMLGWRGRRGSGPMDDDEPEARAPDFRTASMARAGAAARRVPRKAGNARTDQARSDTVDDGGFLTSMAVSVATGHAVGHSEGGRSETHDHLVSPSCHVQSYEPPSSPIDSGGSSACDAGSSSGAF